VNCFTCPGFASVTFVHSLAQSESCMEFVLNTLLRLVNSSRVLNSGRLTSFITLLILPQCFWHLAHFFWIYQCGSRVIFTQYSVDLFMRSRLLLQPVECHDFPFLDPARPPQCNRVPLSLVVPFRATFPSLCMSQVP
jgi:hypothetical protein